MLFLGLFGWLLYDLGLDGAQPGWLGIRKQCGYGIRYV
jgi:hypothetical protein